MRKLIAAMNITLDGYCDHTSMGADDEIHDHYRDLLRSGDAVIYGRVTYELMLYWKSVIDRPTGDKSTDEFAAAIDEITKIVYSRTLKNVDWRNTELKREIIPEEMIALKRQSGRDIFVGSPGLIVALAKLNLIDEYQIAVHPAVVGHGLPLFKGISERIDLKLQKTKVFGGGAVIMYYETTGGRR